MIISGSKQSQTLGGERKICLLFRFMLYSKTQKIRKRDLFIIIALGVTSFLFSNYTEGLGLSLVLLYTV